jgi:hypothetical protein
VDEFANMSDEELRHMCMEQRVRQLGHAGASAGASGRATALLGLGANRSLFRLMGRDTAYWYRRGRGDPGPTI